MTDPEDEASGGGIGAKVAGAVGAKVGTKIAAKATTTGWKTATGNEPPASPQSLRTGTVEAAAWSALSAAAIAVVQVLIRRQIAARSQRKAAKKAAKKTRA